MKKILLTTLLTAMAIAAPALAQQSLKDCHMTRLGCLDPIGPIVPIDQPVLIQVGLKTKIKCEAQTADGKTYLAEVTLVKKMTAEQNQILDYYLVPGYHGQLQVNIAEKVIDGTDSQMFIYSFASEVKDLDHGQGLSVEGTDDISTRVEWGTKFLKLEFSPSSPNQPLKILSAYQSEEIFKNFKQKVPTFTEQELTFADSNCVYH